MLSFLKHQIVPTKDVSSARRHRWLWCFVLSEIWNVL